MPDGETKRRLSDLESRAQIGRDGKPLDGETHGGGRIVRARSRGVGQPVVLRNPVGNRIARIKGWTAADDASLDITRSNNKTIMVTPREAQEGQEFILIVE